MYGSRFEGTIVTVYIDPNATLTKKLGLLLKKACEYAQCKRASMLVEDGVVTFSRLVSYDELGRPLDPQAATAETLLAALTSPDGLTEMQHEVSFPAPERGPVLGSLGSSTMRGVEQGLAVAAAPGAIVGAAMGGVGGVSKSIAAAADCNLSGFLLSPIEGLMEGAAAGGALTKAVLGAPCAVVGAAIGAVGGGVEAISGGIKGLVTALSMPKGAGPESPGEPVLLPVLSAVAAADKLGMLS